MSARRGVLTVGGGGGGGGSGGRRAGGRAHARRAGRPLARAPPCAALTRAPPPPALGPAPPRTARRYSASKAYVDYFSRSLHREYAARGVWVSCQSPYFVASKMSKIRVASLFTPSPDQWARSAVAAIGAPGGDADSTVPYWPHALQDGVMLGLPRWAVTSYVMSLHAGLRARFLKKVAKDAKAQ